MKILIPILTLIMVISGCSPKKEQITTPENATIILLCSSVLQTNNEIHVVHMLDESIKGSIDPVLLDETKIIKGLFQPYFDDLNVPEKYFILARPKIGAPDINSFIVKYQWSGIPVYDESVLEHKDDIQYLQSEFERQMKSVGEIKYPTEKEIQQFIKEKEAEPVN